MTSPQAKSTSTPKEEKYPKRLWLAGPAPYVAQETILMADGIQRLEFYNGSLLVSSAEEEATVRKALGSGVYDEDLKTLEVHPRSGWGTLSQKAYNAHVRVVEQ